MENWRKQTVMMALILAGAMAICSCSETDDGLSDLPLSENLITPEGGVYTDFGGNLILSFPEEAVSSAVEFTVHLCLNAEANHFVLHPFQIEPLLIFNKPVNVRLKYDGILATSPDSFSEEACLVATIWNSEVDFLNKIECASCVCYIDFVQKTIEFCICTTGIITIGISE